MPKVIPLDFEIFAEACKLVGTGISLVRAAKILGFELRDFYERTHVDDDAAVMWAGAQIDQMNALRQNLTLHLEEIKTDPTFGTFDDGTGRRVANSNVGVALRCQADFLKHFGGSIIGAPVKGLKNATTSSEILALIRKAVEDRRITADQGVSLSKLAEVQLKAVEMIEASKRLDALENKLNSSDTQERNDAAKALQALIKKSMTDGLSDDEKAQLKKICE